MAPKRKILEEALSIPRKTRSRCDKPLNNYSAISSPAPATMRTSTRATATGEAVATGTPTPVTKGIEIGTSFENTLKGLADAAVTDHTIVTLVNITTTYASGQEEILTNFMKAMLNYASGQEELGRKLKMAMAELLRSYLPEI
jgi:hypothetical protein